MSAPVIEAVVTIAHPLVGEEEHVYPCRILGAAVADLERLHNAVEVYQAGGRGSGRGYQFLPVFGAAIKPAYVLAAYVRVTYPKLG